MKRIKIFLIRIFYLFFNPLRKYLYWFIFRPKTRGVKCVVEFDGKILLTRLAYAHKLYTFPGGGVGKNESYCDAVVREVKEEVGIDIFDVKEIGEYTHNRQYKVDTVKCFGARTKNDFLNIDEQEVSEAKWFNPKDLPKERARQVIKILEMFENNYE